MALRVRCHAGKASSSSSFCLGHRSPVAPVSCLRTCDPSTASIPRDSTGPTCTISGTRTCPSRHAGRGSILCRASSLGDDPARSLKETAAMDMLIDRLLETRSEQQLGQVVADNIFSFDAKFWLRVAARNDTASSKEQQERLQALARNVMLLVDAMVQRTEQQLEDSSLVLQDVLKAAADERGEWFLPLDKNQVARARSALDRHAAQLDEALLSNAYAWIRKCQKDGMDTMSALIQKVLQLYAARQLSGPERDGVVGAVNEVLFAEEQDWASVVRRLASNGSINEAAFMEVLQRRMESTVLGLTSGSYAQRVQAEYLKEVETRAKSVFRELAAGK